MERRNTIQRELILNAVRSLRRHVTADEVYDYVYKEHPSVSKGTVYRNLNILADDGAIKKVEIPNGSDIYDFTLTEHYHARCISCGKVYDIEFDKKPDLLHDVSKSQEMKLLGYDILFRGICKHCQKD